MPQLNTLVLKDGAATPADHTFEPRDVTAGIATLVESTGIPLGDRRVTVSVQRTASGRVKPTVKFVVPVTQEVTEGGATVAKIVRTGYADLTFNFDPGSTTQERKDLIAFVRNSLATAQTMMVGALQDLNGIY